MSLEYLEKQVSQLRRNKVANKSRYIYHNSSIKFLKWLYRNKIHLLTQIFLDFIKLDNNHDPCDQSIRDFLNLQDKHPPILFESISAKDFLTWIVPLKTVKEKSPGYSKYNGHQSSFFNLFRDYGNHMSEELSTELQNNYTGLKRTIAVKTATSNVSCKIGKDPLSMNNFWKVKRDHIFGRTFLILCWN